MEQTVEDCRGHGAVAKVAPQSWTTRLDVTRMLRRCL